MSPTTVAIIAAVHITFNMHARLHLAVHNYATTLPHHIFYFFVPTKTPPTIFATTTRPNLAHRGEYAAWHMALWQNRVLGKDYTPVSAQTTP